MDHCQHAATGQRWERAKPISFETDDVVNLQQVWLTGFELISELTSGPFQTSCGPLWAGLTYCAGIYTRLSKVSTPPSAINMLYIDPKYSFLLLVASKHLFISNKHNELHTHCLGVINYFKSWLGIPDIFYFFPWSSLDCSSNPGLFMESECSTQWSSCDHAQLIIYLTETM